MLKLKRYYFGLAATLHDSALAIVDPSGKPIFAEATERYTQCKRAFNFPPDDMLRIPELIREYCEPNAEIVVATSWSTTFLNQLSHLSGSDFLPLMSMPVDEASWPLPNPALLAIGLRNSISQAGLNLASSREIPNKVTIRRYDHHLTHAANAVYTSPFEECAVAVIDGYGESGSTCFYHYEQGRLRAIVASPSKQDVSLGHFYGRLCALCGFSPLKGEEWKVMGLAGYGKHDADIYKLLRPLIQVTDLALQLGCSETRQLRRLSKLRSLFREPKFSPLTAANLAFTGQQVFAEVMTELLNNLYKRGLSNNLALSGGCALNSSYNGLILQRTPFQNLHVPPAPGDDGNALGAAFLAFYEDQPRVKRKPRTQLPYLGSPLSRPTRARMVKFSGFRKLEHLPRRIHEHTAQLLAQGQIIGWIQGRAEFGPRALGNRSIVADPRPRDMKDKINRRVKFREEFRPFAPSILDENGAEYFVDYQTSPYMERTLLFRPEVRKKVPAVVHVDNTGRLQSLKRAWNPRYYDLVFSFYKLTGIPLILNTSFNIMGKPIIHSIEDALGVFLTTGLDALVIDDYLIQK